MGTDAGEVWANLSALLQAQLTPSAWQSLFARVRPVEIDNHVLTLAVGSDYIRQRIDTKHGEVVNSALAGMATHPAAEVHFVVDESLTQDLTLPLSPDSEATAPAVMPSMVSEPTVQARVSEGPADAPPSIFNPRYSFEAFVTGPSNRFPHAAALSVAERPARSYNPLFIYGDAGLGKTHLLHAIGHYVAENYPNMRIRYVSTETFLNQFVDSIRTNNTARFKQHYRDIDVLLVDDIQFIEGKEGFQEEFFHTFNTLHENNRQIVLSSDRPPDNIPTLEDRLRSRFKMGLITDIHPPDIETRLAILRKKAEPNADDIPQDVYEFIAENFSNNIRELEGALTRLTAYASLEDTPVSLGLAEAQLHDVLSANQPKPVTVDTILSATSEMFEFPIEDIIGKNRRRPLVQARQIAMYVCRDLTEMSYPEIARNFGNRDHTTVMHAVDKITKLMAERRQIYDQVTELMTTVRGGRHR